MKITELGSYQMRNGRRAEVTAIEGRYAIGKDHEGRPTMWSNGLAWEPNSSFERPTGYDLISAWKEPTPPVVSWLIVYKDGMAAHTLPQTPEGAPGAERLAVIKVTYHDDTVSAEIVR